MGRTGCGIIDKTHEARNRFSLTLAWPFRSGSQWRIIRVSGNGRTDGRPEQAPRPPARLASAEAGMARATAIGLPRVDIVVATGPM